MTFQIHGPYESPYAGLMMLKLDDASGAAWVTIGPAQSVGSWNEALEKIYWCPIGIHSDMKAGRKSAGRFALSGPVAFGDDGSLERKRHAAFLIEAKTGRTYVWTHVVDGKEHFPFHDVFTDTYWKPVQESRGTALRNGKTIRYTLRPVINAGSMALPQGRLGPALVRMEAATGAAWIARWDEGGGDTDMVWERVKEMSERE